MAFNVKKCCILSITNKKNRLTHDYLIKGEPLDRVPQHEYLGVTIADNLKWTPQVNKAASKASRTLSGTVCLGRLPQTIQCHTDAE